MGRSWVLFPFRLLLGVELDRGAVDAVAQAGRLRAVVEHVSQVPAAVRARHLGPGHEQRSVGRLLDRRVFRRLVEARPAAVRVELGVRLEKLGPAPRAQVHAWGAGLTVLARERALRPLLAQHVVLHGSQLCLPLGFALLDSDFAVLLHAPTLPSTLNDQTPREWIRSARPSGP